ncbi:MAG TPA: phosphatidylglycerophosphatase A [Thermohalobaculum sp.]|nr:phosphatidylglycerophosphatase A [Thermohalobaculum sp.]
MPEKLATLFGIGYLPGAPGTWASLAAIPLAWALQALGGFWLVAPATVALGAVGYWATAQVLAERAAAPGDALDLEWDDADAAFAAPDTQDPSEIVIDELVGMLIALWPLSAGLTLIGAEWHVWPWPGWVLGFLLFRFFDIVKPPPVSWAERAPGALGVMLDDIVAGALTALIALLAAGIAHGRF